MDDRVMEELSKMPSGRPAVGGVDQDGDLLVVLSDGRVFSCSYASGEWSTLEPVPGTKAAMLAESTRRSDR